MVEEQQLKNHFTGFHDLRCRSADNHPLGHRSRTGRYLPPFHLLNFNQTHAACAERLQLIIVAENRNLDPVQLGRLINRRTFRCSNLLVIYCKIYHLNLCSVSLTVCAKWIFIQAP